MTLNRPWKTLLIAYLTLCVISKGYAQVSNPYQPNIIPPSPNAAALAKYSDLPVSTYNGTTDISIPFFSIPAKGLSIPIGLGYHTGGIRLKEEASWVGLGWALNAGGSISRTINDKDDFSGSAYFNTTTPEIGSNVLPATTYYSNPLIGSMGYDMFCDYLVNTDTGTADFTHALQAFAATDMEPDIYNYSFPGHNGKFMITRKGVVLLQKQENIKVQFETNGNSFTITDESGNRFQFIDKEYTKGDDPAWKISSWMLSKIITQLADTVTFIYTQDNTWTSVPADIFEMSRNGCVIGPSSFGTQKSPNEYLNRTLQSIDYSNGQLQFIFDATRTDLQNGKKLNNLKIFSKNSNGSLRYIKEHDFYYSYFNATMTPSTEYMRLRLDSVKEISGTLSVPAYVFTYVDPGNSSNSRKHSYSVDDWGFFNNRYNGTFIPPFNGMVQNIFVSEYLSLKGADKTPDPVYMQYFSLSTVKYPTGGSTALEYEANDYDKSNSLVGPQDFIQQVLVDTTWRLNVSARGTTSGSIDFTHIFHTVPNINVGSNSNLTVSFLGSNGNDALTWHNGNNGLIYFTFQGNSNDITSSSVSCPFGAFCTTPSIPLAITDATTIPYTAYIDPSVGATFSQMQVTITWQELKNVHNTSNPSLTAGGLRIKSITDFNTDNSIVKKRRFSYNYQQDKLGTGTPQTYSYGRLMAFPSYARLEPIVASTMGTGQNGYNCESLTLTGSSNSSVTSATTGNIVGYDTVTEFTIDPVSGSDIGKTVYAYFNSPDTPMFFGGFRLPGLLNMGNNLSGSLISKINYSQSAGVYTPVSLTNNFDHTANRSAYYSLKYSLIATTSGASTWCPTGTCAPFEYLGNFYPSIKSERILLDSTQNIVYDQFDPTKFMSSMTYYYYDNPKHYQVTRSKTFDSKGNSKISLTKYSQDYIPTGQTVTNNTMLDSLINRNMVSEVIEKRDSLYYNGATTNGKVTGAGLSIYKAANTNSMVQDKQNKLDVAGPIADFTGFAISGNTTSEDARYRQVVSMDNYDAKNNIAQYTAVDQTPVSIIWDYKSAYPIAQVKNAILSDIAFTSFEADGTGNWTVASAVRDSISFLTGTKSYNLSSGSISKSGLVSGKIYTLSYWSKNGSYSISGGSVSSKTGRTTNGWTYYEQAVTTSSTTVTITGTGNIDELRLYPSGSLMTSYTYANQIGVTSMNDPNSEITFYEYDALTRLKNIKDYQGNIVKNYQYNYANNCDNCYVPMQTFAGTGTLSYPVGVFNVNGKLLGNAASQVQYVTLWNGDSVDLAIGTLAAGADSMHFKITVNATKSAPSSVTGCRYYQYDMEWNKIDGVRNFNGVYVDYGDGTGMRLGQYPLDSLTMVRAPNTTLYVTGSDPYGGPGIYWIHTYPDTTLKTLTLYHSDLTENSEFDNYFSPALGLVRFKNLRGNLPNGITFFGGSCYQNASAWTVANISNWNSINTIRFLLIYAGDNINPAMHLNFAQDFMANNTSLHTIFFASKTNPAYAGYRDTTFKLTRLKSNWNTYFTNLDTLIINDDHWNREDLSGLPNLGYVLLCATTQNHQNDPNSPLIPIPSTVIDNILNQITSGSGQNISNGRINIFSGGTSRTTSSDAGVAFLKSKGWTIIINNITQ